MADLTKLGIDKLNDDSCQSWTYEAELVLRRENNWFCRTSEAPANAKKAYDAWVQADSKAIGTYHREKASLSSAVHMYRKLANMKLAEEGKVGKFIQETVDKLTVFGDPLTDRFTMGMMLGNLPNSYGTLITALECRAETDLTVGMVREKILSEYRWRKKCDDVIMVGTNKEAVLKIEHRYGGNAKGETKATCHFCHKPGHFKANFFKFKAQHKKE
jgi:hypothetical protein